MQDDGTPGIHVRANALAMIGDGNSADAVASVLRIPRATIEAWLRDAPPVPARPTPPLVTPVDRLRVFDRWNKLRMAALVSVFVALLIISVVSLMLSTRSPTLVAVICVPCWAWAIWAFAYAVRSRSTLDADGVASRSAFLTNRLAYADIFGYRLARAEPMALYLVTLVPRHAPESGPTLQFDDEEIREPAIADWLASLTYLGRDSLEPPVRDAQRASSFFQGEVPWPVGLATIAAIAPLVLSLGQLTDGFGTARPLESLDRTAGTLVQSGPCHDARDGGWTNVDIRTASGLVQTTLPCDIGGRRVSDTSNHAVEFYRDTRPLHASDSTVQFAWDGVVVQRYADVVTREHDWRWLSLGTSLFGAATVACILLLELPARRRRR